MQLYSYVVARDYGFAPNPFHGVCSLATCKPAIRKAASDGDWIFGTGSAKDNLSGHLIYAMQVDEIVEFDNYWSDPRFSNKRPNLKNSKKWAFGDNIYHSVPGGGWHQERSHHTHPDGTPNRGNIQNDTGTTTQVLLGRKYVYWGEQAPEIPAYLRNWSGQDLCARRGHKCHFPAPMIEAALAWVSDLGQWGRVGRPVDWKRTP